VVVAELKQVAMVTMLEEERELEVTENLLEQLQDVIQLLL
jgi:hypothetical protein